MAMNIRLLVPVALLLLFTAGLFFPPPLEAGEAPDSPQMITLVMGPSYPPFYFGGDGDPVCRSGGMLCDFLLEFSKAHPAYSFRIIQATNLRAERLMDREEVDGYALSSPIFVADPTNYIFTEPLWFTGDHVITRTDSGLRYTAPSDLFGLRVGVVTGFSYNFLEHFFESGIIKAVYAPRLDSLIEMLSRNRVDAIIHNRHVSLWQIPELNHSFAEFRYSEDPVLVFGLRIQLRKNRAELAGILNRFIAESRYGLLKRLELEYFSQTVPGNPKVTGQ